MAVAGLMSLNTAARKGPGFFRYRQTGDIPILEDMMDNQLFRKQSMDRISSPEQLQDYMRVTSPGIWMVLGAVIVLLAGLIICSMVGKIETGYEVRADVRDGKASVLLEPETEYKVKKGMILRIEDQDVSIEKVRSLESGETLVTASVSLPGGTYEAEIVTESITPISFLIN